MKPDCSCRHRRPSRPGHLHAARCRQRRRRQVDDACSWARRRWSSAATCSNWPTASNIVSHGLTLSAAKGERVVFGCSSRIRHTLAPDGSSLTFASKGDLIHHWLCCISFEIDRDWMWDALREPELRHPPDEAVHSQPAAGGIQRRGGRHRARSAPRRSKRCTIRSATPRGSCSSTSSSRRSRRLTNAPEPDFPDTIEVSYSIEAMFKDAHAEDRDDPETLELRLPITTPPTQVPRIVSAGIALSPYVRNDTYSATEPRKRQLWIEFAEPVKDPQDAFFARVLAIAPDQLLSRNHPDLLGRPGRIGPAHRS